MKNDMVERIALWVLLCFWLAFFCRRYLDGENSMKPFTRDSRFS
jgi:hypothetical protein